jgi:hypothetical protein
MGRWTVLVFLLLVSACAEEPGAGIASPGGFVEPGGMDAALPDVAAAPDGDAELDAELDADPAPEARQVPPPTVVEVPGRLVAMGDVHGDLEAARAALRLAGAIDEADQWIGGDLVVVQVGDQLDRGSGERAILDLFERLSDDAHAAGGAFYPLLGNHETMNVQLDLRYVFAGGFADFEDFGEGANPNDPDLFGLPPEQWGRVIAFRPGGPYARILAGHNVAMVVGKTLFVHGGILPQHLSYDLDQLNLETQRWMLGIGPEPDVLHGDESPVWSRHYSDETDAEDCALLEEVLLAADLERMVVAHSVQDTINSTCDGRVWRVDVGLADYYGGPLEVMEVSGSEVRVLR